MKAIVCTAYGPPELLQLREVEKPTPKANEVLIKIYAATVTAGDCELRRFDLAPLFWLPVRLLVGITRPRKGIFGQELAGEIEAVGKDVTHFKVGDAVFAATDFAFGAHAEYMTLPSTSRIAIKPANMSYEEAAAVPVGGLDSLHFLRKCNIQRGQTVLINGAGGSIGTFGVQLAKMYGAEVTVVDSAGKFEMLRSIGADHLIDYTKEDFTQNGQRYDVIFDVVGKSSFTHSINSLNENGYYLLANTGLSQMLRGAWTSMRSSKTVVSALADSKADDLVFLRELIEAGKIKSVIDRCYPLAQTAAAHRYVETGEKKGSVVITIPSIEPVNRRE